MGRGDDKGGNDHQVQWSKKCSNLHRVWDSGIIDLQELSYTEMAAALPKAGKPQGQHWQQGSTAASAEEDPALRSLIYQAGKGDDLGYACQTWPVVQEQLLKGGARLAAVLNEVFR